LALLLVAVLVLPAVLLAAVLFFVLVLVLVLFLGAVAFVGPRCASMHFSLSWPLASTGKADPEGSGEQTMLVVPAIGVQLKSPLPENRSARLVVVVVAPPVSVTGLPDTHVMGPLAVMIGALMGVVVVVVVVVMM
jgi:hypothetical protein